MTIVDNYTFRPLLAIIRLSSKELKVLLCVRARVCVCVCEDNLQVTSRGRKV